MNVPPTLDLEGLLSEDRWIRRLARRLTVDEHAAEDLAQDAWVAALTAKAGARPRRARGWLGGVVRHLLADWRRAGARRARREEEVARGEALPSADEIAGELELRRRVTEAFLGLEEPARRTLYLRFFRDQSLKEIAAVEGVSVAAIHERLQRGLARLRARLEPVRASEREHWRRALVALAEGGGGWVHWKQGVLMGTGAKLAASLLVVAGGAYLVLQAPDDREELRAEELVREGVAAEDALASARLAPSATVPSEARTVVPPEPEREGAATALRPAPVAGRVLDTGGEPVARVRVFRSGDELAAATTAGDGSFALEHRADLAEGAQVWADSSVWLTVVPGAEHASGVLVLVARRAGADGVVLDSAGEPVAGARVTFKLRDALYRELGLVRSDFAPEAWRTHSDEQGRFEFDAIGAGPRVFLQVEAQGFRTGEVELPEGATTDLVVTLVPQTSEHLLRGIVLDARGAPVGDAAVSAGHGVVRSGADGRFELAWSREDSLRGHPEVDPEQAWLVAVRAGQLPGRLPLVEALEREAVLVLGPPPLTIRARVVDGAGEPWTDVLAWIGDATPLGRPLATVGEDLVVAMELSVEEELRGGRGVPRARTDESGEFELTDLTERAYQVHLLDRRSGTRAGPFALVAGAEAVELVLPREPVARVAGRVLSAAGEPIAGVTILAQRGAPATEAGVDGLDPTFARIAWLNDAAQPPQEELVGVVTDGEGRFAFEGLALAETELVLNHARFFVRTVALAGVEDPGKMEIVQPLLCELQVDLGPERSLADEVEARDERGAVLEKVESFGTGWSLGSRARLRDGLSGVLSVPETARTLVFYRGGEEVLRRPVELDPTRRVTVRL